MTHENTWEAAKGFAPPSPDQLMARYLQRQSEAFAAGLTAFDASGEVQPYEAGPVQPIDSKPAWREAVAVATHLAADQNDQIWKAPPNWPQLVAAHEPAFALAFCLGNFPQLVRDLHSLLQASDLKELREKKTENVAKVSALQEWAEKAAATRKFPQALLAVAALRLAKLYDEAAAVAGRIDADVPAEWQALWANEKAALAWHRGDVAEARRLWSEAEDSVPVLFNRGMAALFDNDAAAAREALTKAVAELSETSAWYHLARLYLTLAESR